MATINATHTAPTVEGITRKNVLKVVLTETGLGAYGTATGGSTTEIIDTDRLKSTQYDSKDWVGGWARISYDAGGAAAAPEGESSPITTYAPSTGTTTVNPAITAVASGDGYELWKNPNPKDVLDMLDSVLTDDVYMPCWTVLTECPDGDMEQTHTSDWTATDSTLSKVTTFGDALSGKRSLRVLATAANGYADSNQLRVRSGSIYHVSALGYGGADTDCKLVVYDGDNAAEIDSVTHSNPTVARLALTITVPSGCSSMYVRLVTVTNGESSYWDEVCVYPVDATDIKLPWWMKGKGQLLGTFQMEPIALDTDIWDAALQGEQDTRWYVQDSFGGKLRLQSRRGGIGSKPLFILGLRNETAYSNDNTDIKYIDSNLIVAALGFRIFSRLYNQFQNNQSQAAKFEQLRNEWYWRWKEYESQQMEDLTRILSRADAPEVYLNDRFARYKY